MDLEQQLDVNLRWWNEMAGKHLDTPMYREHVETLRSGGSALKPIEAEEVGDVAGKRLLHLQCHVGTDTLSWVRLGAKVTAVDFSEESLRQARGLSEELGLPVELVHSDVLQLGDRFREEFDIVFTSHGALLWLHDLRPWARTIASALVKGGFFYIADAHPMVMTMDEKAEPGRLSVRYPYFEGGDPIRWEEGGSYADQDLSTDNDVTYEWPHSLSEVVTALLDVGLRVTMLHEHRAAPWKAVPHCVLGDDGLYRLPEDQQALCPLLFSLKAVKD